MKKASVAFECFIYRASKESPSKVSDNGTQGTRSGGLRLPGTVEIARPQKVSGYPVQKAQRRMFVDEVRFER